MTCVKILSEIPDDIGLSHETRRAARLFHCLKVVFGAIKAMTCSGVSTSDEARRALRSVTAVLDNPGPACLAWASCASSASLSCKRLLMNQEPRTHLGCASSKGQEQKRSMSEL
jgi:hypothetical protein